MSNPLPVTLDSTDLIDIVSRIQGDDEAAAAMLYAATIRSMRWQAYRKTGCNDAANDLAHDAFTATLVAIKRQQLRDPEKALCFMQSALRRLSAGWIRAKIKERKLAAERTVSQPVAPSHQSHCERRTIANAALSQLREKDREILVRFYLLEQSQETICSDLQLTRTQFRLLKSRAKARFAELGASEQNRQKVTEIRHTSSCAGFIEPSRKAS